MKKILFLFCFFAALFALPVMVFAQGDGSDESPPVLTLTTFTGVIAIISYVVTNLSKFIPAVAEKKFLKIGVSLIVSNVIMFLSWKLGFAKFLDNLSWWQVLIQAIIAGLSACGLYDIIRSIMFPKME